MSVLITGASSGIGRELAVLFGRDGERWGKLYLSGRSIDGLQQTANRFRGTAFSAECEPVSGDLIHWPSAVHMAALSSKVLVLGAGEHAHWSRTLDLTGANLKLINTFLEITGPANDNKQIVYLNSVAGYQTSDWSEAAYSMGKHAMTGYLKSLTKHLASYNPQNPVRVLDVFLNACRTPMTADRPDHDYLIDPREAAQAIYSVISNPMLSAQVTELHIGRFKYPPKEKQ